MDERQLLVPGDYTSWGASRKEVDRAGQTLRTWWGNPNLEFEVGNSIQIALDASWAFRAEFQIPLTKVVMGLRSFLATEGAPVVVAQRLKRLPTMLDKLSRHPHMNLSRMQDIGGCRAIVPAGGQAYIEAVQRRIRMRRWDVVEEYDYVSRPKVTGYRAVHVVVMRDNRLVEIQLRTQQQHLWAETVERWSGRLRHNLKEGHGPEDLLEYFERTAYILSEQEAGRSVDAGQMAAHAQLAQRVAPYFVSA